MIGGRAVGGPSGCRQGRLHRSDIAGQKIYEAAARDIKPVLLKLGSKSPNIVVADADIVAAVMGVVSGIFAATGQTCIAGSRVLLHEDIAADFTRRLIEVAAGARIGDPMDPDPHIGPVTTMPQYEKSCPISKPPRPTAQRWSGAATRWKLRAAMRVSSFAPPSSRTHPGQADRPRGGFRAGPCILTFADEDDAIAIANDSLFGLAAGVWTSDIGRAARMSDAFQAGTVWIATQLTAANPFVIR